MIPWLLARESRQPFSLSVCVRKRYLRWLFDAVPYFFYCILRRPSCVPIRNFLCKGSFWRFKLVYEPGLTKAKGSSRFTKPLPFVNTEPHTCLPLPALSLSIGKIERAHRALNGMQLKKILHSRSGKKSLGSQTLPEYNFKLYKIFRYETELFFGVRSKRLHQPLRR